MKKHTIFTSVNLNYLSRAKILADSIKAHSPNIHFVVVLSEPNLIIREDEIKLIMDKCESFDEVILLCNLSLELNQAVQNLLVTEICTMVKAETMIKLLGRENVEYVTYLDPDIVVYDDVERILSEHKNGDILLTPHLVEEPIREQSVLNNEIAGSMRHGVFNLGFLSCKKSENAFRMLEWWNSRLLKYCRENSHISIWTDQKWFDLALVYFEGIKIVKDKSWNMASWNLDERMLISTVPPTLENSSRLLFYHFSKAPSEGFQNSVKTGLHHYNVLKIAKTYGDMLKNETIVESLAQFLVNQCFVPGRIPNFKKKLDLKQIAKKVPLLTKTIRSNKYSYMLALKLNDLYMNRSRNRALTKSSTLQNLKIDTVYVSHSGGGGVSRIMQNQFSKNNKTESLGLIFPITKDKFSIQIIDKIYYSSEITLDECRQIIDNTNLVVLHHLLGNEELSDVFSTHKNLHIYVHDRYFISQVPFSDSLNFLNINVPYRGINVPLNIDYKPISDEEWQVQNKKIIFNAKKVFFPNNELKSEFSLHYTDDNFEFIPWENYRLNIESREVIPRSNSNGFLNVVILGAPGPHKGFDTVLNLANFFIENEIKGVISLFGDLDFISQERIKELSNIIYFGQVEHYRIMNYLKQNKTSLIGLIPSYTKESYSLAFSDFHTAGVKFLATNHGALKLRSRESIYCNLYEPNAKISEIFSLVSDLNNEKF